MKSKFQSSGYNIWMLKSENKKIKYGKYSGSHFYSIPGFGSKCWVIIANIDVDYDKYIAQGMTPENIVESCIEFLNAPPKSRYGKKRRRKRKKKKLQNGIITKTRTRCMKRDMVLSGEIN